MRGVQLPEDRKFSVFTIEGEDMVLPFVCSLFVTVWQCWGKSDSKGVEVDVNSLSEGLNSIRRWLMS